MQIDIIAELKRGLAEIGISQKQLAARVHVTQSAVTNWLSRGIPDDKLFQVANALGSDRFLLAAIEHHTGLRVFANDLETDDPLVIYMRMEMALKQFATSKTDAAPSLTQEPDKYRDRDIERVAVLIDCAETLVEALESFIGSTRATTGIRRKEIPA